jgi:3-oxoacyl-[acyl-carrier protein] reductase
MYKKVALITGASRGIGKNLAIKFASKGYHLVITCLKNEEKLLELKNYLEESYPIICEAFIGDMGDYNTTVHLFEAINTKFSSLDVVINNAGISHIGLLSDMSIEQWNRIVSTNLTSVFNCSKLALPIFLKKKQGRIINISSVWGNVGASCEVAYSAAKGGMNAFTKALAKEMAPSNIQVNAIACGSIQTEMNGFLSLEEEQALMDEIPCGRLGTPQEVADVAYELATCNSYLTGQVIGLDGGWI